MVYVAKFLALIVTFVHIVTIATFSFIIYSGELNVLNTLKSIVLIYSFIISVVAILYLLRKKLGWWLVTMVFPFAIISGAINTINMMTKGNLLDSDYWALIIFIVSLLLFVINLLPPVRKHFRIL